MENKEIRKTKNYQRLRNVWKGVRNRCYNPKADNYCRYGAKGVTICDEWRHKSEPFIMWALKNGYKPGLTLDRINLNKGYSPNNCRFVSYRVQSCNQGIRKDNTTGHKGVFFDKRNKKYYSSIQVNKKKILVSLFFYRRISIKG